MNYALAWLDIDAKEAFLAVTNVGGEGAMNATDKTGMAIIGREVLG